MQTKQKERVIFLDLIRALAIFMVLITHATEVFYIGEGGSLSIAEGNGFWVNFINSSVRACVPLFVMVSGYLLLPIKTSPEQFYKRRLSRILIPFVIWSLLYIFLPLLWGGTNGTRIEGELIRLTYNFNWSSGHLWFIYMLIGVYLFMPIISPWLKETSQKFELGFLAFWFFTTFHHYFKAIIPDHMMLGESFWNEFSTIWYFSGYIGYIVLAHYIKKYIHWPQKKLIAVGSTLFLIGLAFTYYVFDYRMQTATTVPYIELSWRFCTFNVALMTAGLFLLFKAVNIKNEKVVNVINEFSKFSFGIYLAHMMLQPIAFKIVGDQLSTPVTIFIVATVNYLLSYAVLKLISYLPKSRHITGV